jgi:hypothetical protein
MLSAVKALHEGIAIHIEFVDFNKVGTAVASHYTSEWEEIAIVLKGMPLHLKASDQAGIQGKPNL